MWRSDGSPASHSTFYLVLYYYKVQKILQKQGRCVLTAANLYTIITLDSIMAAAGDGTMYKEVDSIISRVDCHAGNVPGTQFYWRNKYLEFKSVKFYGSYIKRKEVTLFHIGSLAECHAYFLRAMLHSYITYIKDLILHTSSTYIDTTNKDRDFNLQYRNKKRWLLITLMLR